jgi:hypothetical protein
MNMKKMYPRLIALTSGSCAAVIVHIGNNRKWDDFSVHTGYFGAHWFDTALYAMGGRDALITVTFLWFIYAFVPSLLLALLATRFHQKKNTKYD